MDRKYTFGFAEESDAFARRNEPFLERFPRLASTVEQSIAAVTTTSNTADRAVLFLCRQCWEDFMEILLLAANGYGFGALKLVRGMYERAVNAKFLHDDESLAEDFLRYATVEKVKATRAWAQAFPDDPRATMYLAQAESAYEGLEGRYRKMKGWTAVNFVDRAKQCQGLDKLLVEAYYESLAHAHGTALSLTARITWSEEHGYSYEGGPQPEEADKAVRVAHKVLLYVLATLADRFGKGLSEELRTLVADCADAWGFGTDTQESMGTAIDAGHAGRAL